MFMRKLLVSSLLLLTCMTAWGQMSDDKIIEYVQEQQAKGMTQEQIIYNLNRRGVTVQQLQRMRDKYEKQQSTGVLGNTVPTQEQADEFLPSFETENKMSLDHPKNLGFSAGPDTNTFFKYKEHTGLLNVREVVKEAESRFESIFGRHYTGLTESYRTEDADYILITLGSIAGLAREIVDKLREQGEKVGLLRIRYMRPFPNEEIAKAVSHAKAIAVLEKDISFGNEGTVYTNVNSALQKSGINIPTSNYIGGLGGKNISPQEIENIFEELKQEKTSVKFLGIGVR